MVRFPLRHTTKIALSAALLALALFGLTMQVTAADDAKEAKEAAMKAQKDLLKQLDGGAKDVIKAGEKLAKDHKLAPVMWSFKRQDKGGIGLGKDLGQVEKTKDFNSIELLLRRYSSKGPNPGEVAKNADDLVKVGEISAIIAEVSKANTPVKDMGKKKIAEWKRLTEEMQKSSADFIKAAKAKDEKGVIAAAKKLNASCVDCHGIFRDD